MAPLAQVGVRAAEILDEEKGKMPLGWLKVLGIEWAKNRVIGNPGVELLDETKESRFAAHGFVDSHLVSGSSNGRPMKTSRLRPRTRLIQRALGSTHSVIARFACIN